MKEAEEIYKELQSAADETNEKALEKVLDNEKKIREKEKNLDKSKFFNLGRQIKIALSLLKDYKSGDYRDIAWKTVAILVMAVIYFANPFDAIPDFLIPLGFTDDAVVLGFVFNSLKSELKKYELWKENKPEDIKG